MTDRSLFLPVSKQDMQERGWYYYDFLLVTGDAYVDHPSFGTAVISRVLEKEGFRVAVLSQPEYKSTRDFLEMGKPRFAVLINAGNIDSMVAHYTVAKRRRARDEYTPGGKPGRRPDRAVNVYTRLAKEAFPDTPVVIGGIEASLRRFAHYDYWDDAVHPSVLVSSGADILSFGMGERSMTEIARMFKGKKPLAEMTSIRGICFMAESPGECRFPAPITLPSFEQVAKNGEAYCRAAFAEQNENDFARGKPLIQAHGGRYLIQNPPALPLEGQALDDVYSLPYARTWHPDYAAAGGVAAIEEVSFSIIHNRGCFGACNFCALAMHQGRYVSSRSRRSVVEEARIISAQEGFKGYIHDVGGPTANFRKPACSKQKEHGACAHRQCLFPTPCPNLEADESDYSALLKEIRGLPGVKKVFVRSGIRFDYMLTDKKSDFFKQLVEHHVSGQLKVAPEHISPEVLHYMGKPFADVYDDFCDKYYQLSKACGKEQYLVPYLMSSHPGSGLKEAIDLALYLKRNRLSPQQVQDFYPTPGTLSTAMYHTGIDPRTMKPVYVARDKEQKAMQRALLQFGDPKNKQLVLKALREAGREDLIGRGPDCLVSYGGGGYKGGNRGEDKPSGKQTGGQSGHKDSNSRPSPRGARASQEGRKQAGGTGQMSSSTSMGRPSSDGKGSGRSGASPKPAKDARQPGSAKSKTSHPSSKNGHGGDKTFERPQRGKKK